MYNFSSLSRGIPKVFNLNAAAGNTAGQDKNFLLGKQPSTGIP